MGRRGTAEGCSALELSQISGRPRRLYRRGVPGNRGADRHASQNRDCAGIRGDLTHGDFAQSRLPVRLKKTLQIRTPLRELTGSSDKSTSSAKSRCRGGAAPTRLSSARAGNVPDDGKSLGKTKALEKPKP